MILNLGYLFTVLRTFIYYSPSIFVLEAESLPGSGAQGLGWDIGPMKSHNPCLSQHLPFPPDYFLMWALRI